MVISDCIDPTYGMDGKLYDSRKAFENSTSVTGDKYMHPEGGPREATNVLEYKPDEGAIRDAVRAGIEDVKNGRVPPVMTLED